MNRKTTEITLVRNLIDFDEASPKTPRHVVEWWAHSRFEMLVDEQPKDGFTYSPLRYFVDFLGRCSADNILDDYCDAASTRRDSVCETIFLTICKQLYASDGTLQVRSPRQFVFAELHCALLDLAREINQHADVTNEDMEEWLESKKS